MLCTPEPIPPIAAAAFDAGWLDASQASRQRHCRAETVDFLAWPRA